MLADEGWDVYFPRRDKGFDMIVSRPHGSETVVRPIQVKGKYASDDKTDKSRYGYVGKITAFHEDMVLAIPYFISASAAAPVMTAWMPRSTIKPNSRGWACEPAKFAENAPKMRREFARYFDKSGLDLLLSNDAV